MIVVYRIPESLRWFLNGSFSYSYTSSNILLQNFLHASNALSKSFQHRKYKGQDWPPIPEIANPDSVTRFDDVVLAHINPSQSI